MNPLTTFDSTKEALIDILQSIKTGKTQLPDFQRGWVWDDDRIRSLLASISLSYPVGTVMLLQTGNPDVSFKPRLVEGVNLDTPPEPERLILDGQQRLTSLFQALLSGKPVATFNNNNRSKPTHLWYYLDINKAINPNTDPEDAIIALPENKIVRNFRGEVVADYSTEDKEIEAQLLPFSLVFDNASLTTWQMKYLSQPNLMQERLKNWNNLMEIIQRYQQYQMPVIYLRKETPKEAVCLVFEKVNTGGVHLTVFELITATFAADDYSLRDDWEEREKRLKKHQVLDTLENTDFLQAISLLTTRARRIEALARGTDITKAPAISCKRKDVLKLALEDYQTWAQPLTEGLEKAAKFLHNQNIFTSGDLPYRSQLVPLGSMFAILGDKGDNDGVKAKIAFWYWCGIFGELYGGSTETRFAKDVPEVLEWLEGKNKPTTIIDANFVPIRLHSLRRRNSAAYKGLYALLLKDGSLDFRTGDRIDYLMYFSEIIDIHHIFPRKWCQTQGIEAKWFDSIVNKTPVSAKTNRIIGGKSPSVYLNKIQKDADISVERMDEILSSHAIEATYLRADDFYGFFQARKEALLSKIETAMGKPIIRESLVENEETIDYNDDDDDSFENE